MSKGPKSGNVSGSNTSNSSNSSHIKIHVPQTSVFGNSIGSGFSGPNVSGRGSVWVMDMVK